MQAEDNNKRNIGDGQNLPPELNWDRMESGIMDKMAELETAEVAMKTVSTRTRIIIGVAVVVGILLLMIPCRQEQGQEQAQVYSQDYGAQESGGSSEAERMEEQMQAVSSEAERRGKQGQEYTFTQETDAQVQGGGDTKPSSSMEEQNLVKDRASSEAERNEEQALSSEAQRRGKQEHTSAQGFGVRGQVANQSMNQLDNLAATSVNEIATESKASENDNTSTNTDITELVHSTGTSVIGTEERSALNVATIDILSTDKIEFNRTLSPPLNTPTLNSESPIVKAMVRPNRIGALGGIALWGMGYGSTEPERSEFEQTLVSFQSELSYIHTFPSKFSLMVGLNYTQLESQFDWVGTIDNYTVTLTDTIIAVNANSFTGQQTFTRGDVDLQVPATRTVLHYNTTRLIQVPVAVGMSWSADKWTLDALAGTAFNVATSNTGRTLLNGEIYDYDGSETAIVSNQWAVHGTLTGRFTYFFTKRFGVSSGVQLQKSLTDWSAQDGLTMRPWVASFQLGLSYSLD